MCRRLWKSWPQQEEPCRTWLPRHTSFSASCLLKEQWSWQDSACSEVDKTLHACRPRWQQAKGARKTATVREGKSQPRSRNCMGVAGHSGAILAGLPLAKPIQRAQRMCQVLLFKALIVVYRSLDFSLQLWLQTCFTTRWFLRPFAATTILFMQTRVQHLITPFPQDSSIRANEAVAAYSAPQKKALHTLKNSGGIICRSITSFSCNPSRQEITLGKPECVCVCVCNWWGWPLHTEFWGNSFRCHYIKPM